jgi:hypothetical protein
LSGKVLVFGVDIVPTFRVDLRVMISLTPFRALLASVLVFSALKAEEPLPSIFNGKDLTGWKTPEQATYWKVVDGVLVGESDDQKKGSMLYTQQSFGDVVMEADVKWSGDIDSGFMLRQPEIQMQIGISLLRREVSRGRADQESGRIDQSRRVDDLSLSSQGRHLYHLDQRPTGRRVYRSQILPARPFRPPDSSRREDESRVSEHPSQGALGRTNPTQTIRAGEWGI